MTESNTDPGVSRRSVLRATAAAGSAAIAAPGLAGRASAQSGLKSWFNNTSNFDGVVDRTGEREVTVEVGAEANGGGYGFGPAAVRVDPGTTVTWEWVGGTHNVVAADGSFESEMSGEQGFTFSQTLDSTGVVRYYCTPHKPMGMKGALVVGDVDVAVGSSESDEGSGQAYDFGDWFSNTSNFEGVVDATGEREVAVEVGVRANGGQFGFGPAAVQVDPGTTVTWEWAGGTHNVVASGGSFESELTNERGHTFSQTFDSAGVYRYYCTPHEPMGMRGAVVVGGPSAGGDGGPDLLDYGTLAAGVALGVGLVSPLAAKAFRRG